MEKILDKYNLTKEENIALVKRNMVDYIWKSANLEGIAVTYPQTSVIFEGLSVNGLRIDEINSINNLKHTWQFLLDNIDYPVDFRYISQINKIVGEYNVVPFAGELRTSIVDMGGTEWKPEIPNREKIEKNLEEINQIKSITERAITLCLYLMRTQPFFDGNKRTAMMTANQVMVQNGKGIISVPLKNLEKFRELLIDFYETDDMKKIKNFLYENCIIGLESKKINRNLDEKEKNPWEQKIKADRKKDLGRLD